MWTAWSASNEFWTASRPNPPPKTPYTPSSATTTRTSCNPPCSIFARRIAELLAPELRWSHWPFRVISRCHSERSEESLRGFDCQSEKEGDIPRPAQNDNERNQKSHYTDSNNPASSAARSGKARTT